MQYVNEDGSVYRFSDREFRRQLRSVASGEHGFDLSKGRLVALETWRMSDVSDPEFADDFLNPAPVMSAEELKAFSERMAEQYRAKQIEIAGGLIVEEDGA